MTNYYERLYKILDNLVFYACEYEAGKDVDLDAETWKAKQAIKALIADEVKKARLVAVISEWEQIDGEDTYYWDYRENGKTTEKVYLTPIERNDELELQLAELQSTLGDKE